MPFALRFVIPLQPGLPRTLHGPGIRRLDGQQAANLINYCGWESAHVLRCVRVRHDFDEPPLVAGLNLANNAFEIVKVV